MSRSLTALAGVALAVVGIALVVAPGLATFLPFGDVLVLGFGLVLVLGGVETFYRRWNTAPEYTAFADPETTLELPTPGAAFDAELDALDSPRAGRSRRRHFRERVETLAVETLQRHYDVPAAEAEARLDAGTWTDDPFAAAFFTGSLDGVPRRARVREMLGGESAYSHRCRRAVGELHALLEDDDE